MKSPFRKRSRSRLEALAGELGLQSSYVDVKGETQNASEDGMLAVIRAMGLTISSPGDIDDHLRFRRLREWRRPLPPVSVAWRGESALLHARVPAEEEWSFSLQLESGEIIAPRRVAGSRSKKVEGQEYIRKRLSFGRDLPIGYHSFIAQNGSERTEASLFVAPARCYSPEAMRSWGLFAPLYALRSDRDWGAGDLTDLADFVERMRAAGGDFVGTLPILASFLDEPFEPSPYAPVSRLFWNELYLDIERLPELGLSAAARTMIGSSEFEAARDALRAADLVDYRKAMALKRRVLSMLADAFFERATEERRGAFSAYVEKSPELSAYAKFRAQKERRTDDLSAVNYHRYAQWAMHEQLDRFAERARESGPGLYLDYPLGVHPDGYDVASRPHLFARDASAGAPPDAFFTKGQSWGFPPMRPDAMREEGFEYVIKCIRQQLRYAGMLRIDHIMGLHRLYWVPVGSEAKDGVYVRNPDQELFAILAIESHRHRSVIIGEDLGTVPEEIRDLMKVRGVKRMFVLQYELSPAAPVPVEPPAEAIASLNTHDMPTFHSFWNGADIDDRVALALLGSVDAEEERQGREKIRRRLTEFFQRRRLTGDSLEAALHFLAGSDAEIVLLNLEDLWRESKPQNVPGTSAAERPNWQRKLRYEISAAFDLPEVRERLREVEQRRRR